MRRGRQGGGTVILQALLQRLFSVAKCVLEALYLRLQLLLVLDRKSVV